MQQPDEMESVFDSAGIKAPPGIEHGTITAVINDVHEITKYSQ